MTAPLLFMLVLGAIEFSRANMLVHTASIAATEAARRSIVPGATVEDVRLRALDELDNVGIIDARVDVNPAEIVEDTTQVSVNLTIPVSMRNGYSLARLFLGKNVVKGVTLQREGKAEDVDTETVTPDGVVSTQASGKGNDKKGKSGRGSGDDDDDDD